MAIYADNPIPARAGVGLRAPHYMEVINNKPDIAWFEAHSENFFADGGMPIYVLEKIRERYPISLHGVGLSLGTDGELNKTHLTKLKALVDRFNPGLVSEHISWSMVNGLFLNDLLPLPYTQETLNVLVSHINQTQDFLGRRILIENPSTYLEFTHSSMPEYGFIKEAVNASGCGLLLDINNIYVSAHNHGFNPYDYIKNIPVGIVQEIHLAGHAIKRVEGGTLLIDHHGDYITDPVWDLYKAAIVRLGNIPTLIEWDTNIPALKELTAEARKADAVMGMITYAGENHAIA